MSSIPSSIKYFIHYPGSHSQGEIRTGVFNYTRRVRHIKNVSLVLLVLLDNSHPHLPLQMDPLRRKSTWTGRNHGMDWQGRGFSNGSINTHLGTVILTKFVSCEKVGKHACHFGLG